MQQLNKKSLFKRFWWLFVVAVLILGVAGYLFWQLYLTKRDVANPQPNDVVITANPVDLSTIQGISKFRSCMGHEFGYNSAFEGREAKCSLKHYFVPLDKYTGTTDAVPVYAPFDGVIVHTESGTDQFLIEQKPYEGWIFAFTHIMILSNLHEGSEVKAGQLVGYSNMIKTHAFDLVLSANKKEGYRNYDWHNNYDSIFNHMSAEVLAEYAARGITKENIIIPKVERDQNPCECDYGNPSISDYCNFFQLPFSDSNNGVMLSN